MCYLCKCHCLIMGAIDSKFYDRNYLMSFVSLFGPSGGILQFFCNAAQPIIVYLHINRFMIPGRDVTIAAYLSIIITILRFLGKRIHKILHFLLKQVNKLCASKTSSFAVKFEDAYAYLDDEIEIEYRLRTVETSRSCMLTFALIMKICKMCTLLLSIIVLVLNRFTSTCIRQHQLGTLLRSTGVDSEILDPLCTAVSYIHQPFGDQNSLDWFIDRVESNKCKQLVYQDEHLVSNSKWFSLECLTTLEIFALFLTTILYTSISVIFLSVKLRTPTTQISCGSEKPEKQRNGEADEHQEQMTRLYASDL